MAQFSLSMRNAAILSLAAATPIALAACESKADSEGAIGVTSTDEACDLGSTDAQTGDVKFEITNNGSKVTEFYVFDKNRVLGEVENIGPGVKGNLKVEITDPGTYDVACKPGMVGTGIRKQVTVSGEKKQKSQAPADVLQAKNDYITYVRQQVGELTTNTATFVASVKSGDLAAARANFGKVRSFYERIEPVAESFPDLDPLIDMRWDDTEDGKQPFTGFHRIERFLWPPQAKDIGEADGKILQADADDAKKNDNTASISKAADDLLTNVKKLQTEVTDPGFEFNTDMFVNGPKALIDEIAQTKVAGEEDRYSHTDLWDFAANVEGSQKLIDGLKPVINAKNKDLMTKIDKEFAAVTAEIDKLREDDGFRSYDQVDEATRRKLSDQIDALSTTLSQVPGVVLQK